MAQEFISNKNVNEDKVVITTIGVAVVSFIDFGLRRIGVHLYSGASSGDFRDNSSNSYFCVPWAPAGAIEIFHY